MRSSTFFPSLSLEAVHGLLNRKSYLSINGPISRFPEATAMLRSLRCLSSVSDDCSIIAVSHTRYSDFTRQMISRLEIQEQILDGSTIQIRDFDRHEPVAEMWCELLAEEMQLSTSRIQCNAYLGASGAGLPAHCDPHAVVVVQCHGSKSWRLCKNNSRNLPSGSSHHLGLSDITRSILRGRPPALSEMWASMKCVPGTVLFIPSGMWHETHVSAVTASLTFGILQS